MAKTVLSRDLIPLSEFRANASSIIANFKDEPDKAIVVTQNGRAAAVVLSIKEYEDFQASMKEMRQIVGAMIDLYKGKAKLYTTEEVMAGPRKQMELQEKLQEVLGAS